VNGCTEPGNGCLRSQETQHRPDIRRPQRRKRQLRPDRDAADAIREIAADGQRAAHDNRAFHGRAVRFLAREQGISQFLDIGAGMPADQNNHEIASGINEAARTPSTTR